MEYLYPTLTVAVCVPTVQSHMTDKFTKMICLIVCILVCSSLSSGQSLPPTPTPIPFSTSAGLPTTVFPFTPTPRPLGYNGRYNDRYYNPAAEPAVPILSYSSEHGPEPGSYSFSFATADGKQVQESGFLKDAFIDNAGEPQGTQVVQGSYAYVAPDGTPIQVSYVADENGFHPSGVHIRADGKGILPTTAPILDKDGKPIYDPVLNRYNPYNRYNVNAPFNRSYDPRYPYDPKTPFDTRYPYNPKSPYDPRYPYDSKYPYDPKYPFDPKYPNDPKYPYDQRYPQGSRFPYDPARYNTFNPYRPSWLNKDQKEAKV